MMHLDEELVQRLADRELDPGLVARTERHLAGCSECRERVARVRREDRELAGLLATIDHPVPRVPVERVVARAAARRPIWLGRAAIVGAALGIAGVASAVPGSPVRSWVRAALGGTAERGAQPSPAAQPTAIPEAPASGGIAVAPGRSLTIRIAATQSSGDGRVSLTDGALVEIKALGPGVTFKAEIDQVTVGNVGSTANFEVAIPRSATRVEILVGGRRAFLKEGDRLAGTPDSAGSFRLTLRPEAP